MMQLWESEGVLPMNLATLICQLPRGNRAFRPIALICSLCRVRSRFRQTLTWYKSRNRTPRG
eukprot:410158-Prorocentrum_lima.AAC.1